LLKVNAPKVPFVSLFSGAMGLDLGLESVGFESVVAVENDADAVRTMRRNRPNLSVIDRSIVTTGASEILKLSGLTPGEVPLVVGGPPCQAFSVFGKRNGLDDTRGQMLFEYLRVVDELRPHVFVMENVRGLLSMPLKAKPENDDNSAEAKHGSLLRSLIARFEEIGYRVDCFVVNAVNYGAPQLRERIILIGNRHNKVVKFPEPSYSNRPEDGLPPFATLGDAIGGDFIDPDTSIMDFSPRKLAYLRQIPPGGNWRSLPVEIQMESMGKSWYLKGGRSAYWRRLSFAFPSPTVVTMPNHAGTSMCHPVATRAITVGEAAAIQEFPADWVFEGTAQSKFKQIGNAVPVRLGAVAGEVVRELLTRIAEEGDGSTGTMVPSSTTHVRPHVRTRQYWKDGVAISGDVGYYATA
jgi:DNA (cytosine-5)-methyltransferase 1